METEQGVNAKDVSYLKNVNPLSAVVYCNIKNKIVCYVTLQSNKSQFYA